MMPKGTPQNMSSRIPGVPLLTWPKSASTSCSCQAWVSLILAGLGLELDCRPEFDGMLRSIRFGNPVRLVSHLGQEVWSFILPSCFLRRLAHAERRP